MKARTLAVAIASAFSIAATTLPALAAESHDHGHPAAAGMKLSLDEGRKWATDAPLRQGMSRIRTAFESRFEAIHKGALTAEESRTLGREAEAQMAYIVSNCKLTPAADANLHVVLGELQGSLDGLRKSSGPEATRAAERAVRALNTYGDYFDHPGWTALS